MDICACRYEVDELDVGDLLGVLMKRTHMFVEVDGNIFPALG